MANQKHYVYVLFDEKGVPFYVGKGTGSRYRHHLSRSHNVLVNTKIKEIRSRGYEPKSEIVAFFKDEQDALDTEGFMIQHYGIKIEEGILCNFETNPRSPQTGKRKAGSGHRAKPVYHKGFIFPSRAIAAKATDTAVNTFTRMVRRQLTVYLDDPFFEECLADYSKYLAAQDKWSKHLEKRHPNAKRIVVDGVLYDARDDAAEQTKYSLWHIKRYVNDPNVKNIYYLDT